MADNKELSAEETEEDLIELIDDEDNIIKFRLLDVTEYKGEKYALLLAAEPNDAVAEDEVAIFRYKEEEQDAPDVPDSVAKQDIVEKMLELKSDIPMFRGTGADQFLKCLISDNTVDTEKATLFLKNYENIGETIVQKRMSISGVDEDEEALDMLKFQNAYNLASRMIQTMTEMYNRLILETGV